MSDISYVIYTADCLQVLWQITGLEKEERKKNLFRVVGNLLLSPSQDICETADQLDYLRSKQDVAEITPTMKRDSWSDTHAKRSPGLFLPPQPRHMGYIWDSCAHSWQLLLTTLVFCKFRWLPELLSMWGTKLSFLGTDHFCHLERDSWGMPRGKGRLLFPEDKSYINTFRND